MRPRGRASLEETRHPFLEVRRFEVSSVGGWALDDVREADPEAWKLSIVLGAEGVGTERSPNGLAQLRRGERGPEPARRTREVVPPSNRVQPGIDTDEDEVEPWPEIVGQGPERVSLTHPAGTGRRRALMFCAHDGENSSQAGQRSSDVAFSDSAASVHPSKRPLLRATSVTSSRRRRALLTDTPPPRRAVVDK